MMVNLSLYLSWPSQLFLLTTSGHWPSDMVKLVVVDLEREPELPMETTWPPQRKRRFMPKPWLASSRVAVTVRRHWTVCSGWQGPMVMSKRSPY